MSWRDAHEPRAVRDPAAPTQADMDKHNLPHMPASVAVKARDRPHWRADEDSKRIPQILFDYMLNGVNAEGYQETVAIRLETMDDLCACCA